MNTAWASFNIYTGVKMKHEYQRFIVAGACNGVDVLGGWWDERLRHSVCSSHLRHQDSILMFISGADFRVEHDRHPRNGISHVETVNSTHITILLRVICG